MLNSKMNGHSILLFMLVLLHNSCVIFAAQESTAPPEEEMPTVLSEEEECMYTILSTEDVQRLGLKQVETVETIKRINSLTENYEKVKTTLQQLVFLLEQEPFIEKIREVLTSAVQAIIIKTIPPGLHISDMENVVQYMGETALPKEVDRILQYAYNSTEVAESIVDLHHVYPFTLWVEDGKNVQGHEEEIDSYMLFDIKNKFIALVNNEKFEPVAQSKFTDALMELIEGEPNLKDNVIAEEIADILGKSVLPQVFANTLFTLPSCKRYFNSRLMAKMITIKYLLFSSQIINPVLGLGGKLDKAICDVLSEYAPVTNISESSMKTVAAHLGFFILPQAVKKGLVLRLYGDDITDIVDDSLEQPGLPNEIKVLILDKEGLREEIIGNDKINETVDKFQNMIRSTGFDVKAGWKFIDALIKAWNEPYLRTDIIVELAEEIADEALVEVFKNYMFKTGTFKAFFFSEITSMNALEDVRIDKDEETIDIDQLSEESDAEN